MALPVKTGLPDLLDLPAGWTIRFTALDATTGNVVAAVKISNASIMARSIGGNVDELANEEWVLVPGPKQA